MEQTTGKGCFKGSLKPRMRTPNAGVSTERKASEMKISNLVLGTIIFICVAVTIYSTPACLKAIEWRGSYCSNCPRSSLVGSSPPTKMDIHFVCPATDSSVCYIFSTHKKLDLAPLATLMGQMGENAPWTFSEYCNQSGGTFQAYLREGEVCHGYLKRPSPS